MFHRLWIALLASASIALTHAHAACPTNLDDNISTPGFGFSVDFTDDDPADVDYVTLLTAQRVANALDAIGAPAGANDPPGSTEAFIDLGFLTPFFNTDPEEVCINDLALALGSANFCRTTMNSGAMTGQPEPDIRIVTDHENFHHVQYAYINNGSTDCRGCGSTWG